jgi:hypothetical protein
MSGVLSVCVSLLSFASPLSDACLRSLVRPSAQVDKYEPKINSRSDTMIDTYSSMRASRMSCRPFAHFGFRVLSLLRCHCVQHSRIASNPEHSTRLSGWRHKNLLIAHVCLAPHNTSIPSMLSNFSELRLRLRQLRCSSISPSPTPSPTQSKSISPSPTPTRLHRHNRTDTDTDTNSLTLDLIASPRSPTVTNSYPIRRVVQRRSIRLRDLSSSLHCSIQRPKSSRFDCNGGGCIGDGRHGFCPTLAM